MEKNSKLKKIDILMKPAVETMYLNILVNRFMESEFRQYIEILGSIYYKIIFNFSNNSYTYNTLDDQTTHTGIPLEIKYYKKFIRKIIYNKLSGIFTFIPENDDFKTMYAISYL